MKFKKLAAAVMVASLMSSTALAHTNSIGYVGDGNGGINFWYGSWHDNTQFNEAEIKITKPDGSTSIDAFNLLSQDSPAGLISGVNYFGSDGTQLIPYDINTGGGESYTWQGLNYANVDPQYPGSAGTMGTLGMIKNTMMSKNAKVQMGGFGNTVPEEVDKKALQILGLAYQDMINNPKGTTRLTPNVTYSHIAGGDDNWVAMNMKFNDAFSKKFKGTKDEPGLTKKLTDQLRNEGITMYVPKAEANNIFTNNAERTSLDILMDYNNEITIDSEPKYFKGTRITRGPNGYYQEGLYASGINQDGSFQWSNFQTPLPNNVDLTDAFNKLNNNLVVPVANQMRMLEKQWNLANGIKDVNAQ